MRRRQLPDLGKGRLFDSVVYGPIVGAGNKGGVAAVDRGSYAGQKGERCWLGGEGDAFAGRGVIQRLDAEAVATEPEPPGACIEKGNGHVPVDRLHRGLEPYAQAEPQEESGIAARATIVETPAIEEPSV